MPKPVSAFSLFKPSKEAVLNNFFTFLVIVFLPAFLILVGEAMNLRNIQVSSESGIWQLPSIRPESIPYYWLGGLLSFALLPAGFYLELQAAKGEKIGIGESFAKSLKYFWRVTAIIIITFLIIIAGLIAFIVPGLIFMRRYFLAPYILIDKDLRVGQAMAASAKMTKKHSGAIWSVIGVTILLSVFQVIPVWGGLITLIATTLYACAPPLRYLELTSKKHPR